MKKYAIALLTMSLSTFTFAGPGQQDTTALTSGRPGYERDHGCAR
jgi:hypothetical protein